MDALKRIKEGIFFGFVLSVFVGSVMTSIFYFLAFLFTGNGWQFLISVFGIVVFGAVGGYYDLFDNEKTND